MVELQHGARRQREDAPHASRVESHAFRDGAQHMLKARAVALVQEQTEHLQNNDIILHIIQFHNVYIIRGFADFHHTVDS